jgi:hypothetical protein
LTIVTIVSANRVMAGWRILSVNWDFPTRPAVWGRKAVGLTTDHWTVVVQRVDDSSRTIHVDVTVQDRRLICTSVGRAPGSPGLTATDLRTLPVYRLMQRSALFVVAEVEHLESGALALEPSARSDEEATHELPELLGPQRSPGRPRGDSLTEMVAIYRAELAKGNRAPRPVIAEKMGYPSVGYVGKRLNVARRRGELGPAPSGKAGEIQQPLAPQSLDSTESG